MPEPYDSSYYCMICIVIINSNAFCPEQVVNVLEIKSNEIGITNYFSAGSMH